MLSNKFYLLIVLLILSNCGHVLNKTDDCSIIQELSEETVAMASARFTKLFIDGEKSLPLLVQGLDDKAVYTAGSLMDSRYSSDYDRVEVRQVCMFLIKAILHKSDGRLCDGSYYSGTLIKKSDLSAVSSDSEISDAADYYKKWWVKNKQKKFKDMNRYPLNSSPYFWISSGISVEDNLQGYVNPKQKEIYDRIFPGL